MLVSYTTLRGQGMQDGSVHVRQQVIHVDDAPTSLHARLLRCFDDVVRRAAFKPHQVLLLDVDSKRAGEEGESRDSNE